MVTKAPRDDDGDKGLEVGRPQQWAAGVTAVRETVAMPGGGDSVREVVRHIGAVCVAAVDDEGRIVMVRQYRHPVGGYLWELPAGLRDAGKVACTDALGRHFATVAHLEAASIQAFLRLSEELELHGADVALRDAALVSALEEVMHTDVSTRLAHRFGGTPTRLQVDAPPPRALFDVALDNAVEGCVRETFGALVAHHQALHARDEEVRGAMVRIAEDETRHAELSWAIHRWAREQLSASEREALRAAQQQAVAKLREEAALPLDAALVTEAGMPAPEAAAALVDTLATQLWA